MNTKLSLSLAALTAAGIFALYSAPSFAASTTRPTTPTCTVNCGGGGGGGGGGGEIAEPGDPFFPPDGDLPEDGGGPDDGGPDDGDIPEDGDVPEDGGTPGEPGNDPDFPGLSKQDIADLEACLARLDGLPQVSETQINQFGQPYKVTLKPICEVTSLTQVSNVFIENGNVFGLEPALKSNDTIRNKLGQSAYKARDVVGIDFDADGNAILLVHKRRG